MLEIDIVKTARGKKFHSLEALKAAKGKEIAANAMRQIIGSDRWLKPIPASDGTTDSSLEGFYFYFETADLVYDAAIQLHFGKDLLFRVLHQAGSAPKCIQDEVIDLLRNLHKKLKKDGVLVIAAMGQGPKVIVSSEPTNHGGIH